MLSNLLLKSRSVYIRVHKLSSYPKIEMAAQTSDNFAVLRKLEGNEKFTFSFHLRSERFGGIDKQFNMCRNLDENMSEFVSRLTSNVEKIIHKKYKNY